MSNIIELIKIVSFNSEGGCSAGGVTVVSWTLLSPADNTDTLSPLLILIELSFDILQSKFQDNFPALPTTLHPREICIFGHKE